MGNLLQRLTSEEQLHYLEKTESLFLQDPNRDRRVYNKVNFYRSVKSFAVSGVQCVTLVFNTVSNKLRDRLAIKNYIMTTVA